MDINKYLDKVSKNVGLNPTNIHRIYSQNSKILKFDSGKNTYAFKVSLIDSLTTEVFFINTLKTNLIPCEELVTYDFTKKVIPYSFIITKWIKADSFIGHINDRISIKGGIEYGKELTKIHKIKTKGFGLPLNVYGSRWSSLTWNDALKSFFQNNIKNETPLKIFHKNTVDVIIGKTINNPKISVPTARLIHGDLPNCLATIKPTVKLLAFIDPGGIVGGDPMYDLSFVYNYNEEGKFGNGFMEGLRIGYVNIKQLTKYEEYRFNHLRLFHLFWKTCYFYDQGWKYSYLMSKTNAYLKLLIEKR